MNNFRIHRVCFSCPEEFFDRIRTSGMLKNFDNVIMDIIDDYLEKMGY